MLKGKDLIKDVKAEYVYNDICVCGYNGKKYQIKICNKIKDSDIMNIVKGILVRSDMCIKEKIQFDIMMSIYILLIKYLTDIKIDTYTDIKKQFIYEIEVLNALVDLGIFDQILNNIDKSQIKKIEDAFVKYDEIIKEVNSNIIIQNMKGNDNG